jgi:hypothetical protein
VRVGTAAPVVAHLDVQHPRPLRAPHPRPAGPTVLGGVRDRLRDDEPRGRLDGRGRPGAQVDRDVERDGGPLGELGERRTQSFSRVQPVHQLAQLGERQPGLVVGAIELGAHRRRVLLDACHPQRHRDGGEPQLRAVVQVAFDPPPLRVEQCPGGGTPGERGDQPGEHREEQQRGDAETELCERRTGAEPGGLERRGLRNGGQDQ